MTRSRSPSCEVTPTWSPFWIFKVKTAFLKNIKVGKTISVKDARFIMKITRKANCVGTVGRASSFFIKITGSVAGTDCHWNTVVTPKFIKSGKKIFQVTFKELS